MLFQSKNCYDQENFVSFSVGFEIKRQVYSFNNLAYTYKNLYLDFAVLVRVRQFQRFSHRFQTIYTMPPNLLGNYFSVGIWPHYAVSDHLMLNMS